MLDAAKRTPPTPTPTPTPTTLMDLPDELWAEIFLQFDTFSEVEALRSVCRRFQSVSDGVLRRAFIKFECEVTVQIGVARRAYEASLRGCTTPPKQPIPMFNLAHRVNALSVLAAQFDVVKTLVWQFARVATGYNLCAGEIVDKYAQVLATLLTHVSCDHREEDFENLLERLRAFTSWYGRFFGVLLKKKFDVLLVPARLFDGADAQDMLAGMTLLALLEACKDAACVDARIHSDGGRSRICVRYIVNKSWFRVDKFAFWERQQPLARKLIHLVRFVKEMVLIVNHRYLQIEHRRRYKRITSHDYPPDAISICGISCINKDYTYSEDCEKQTLLFRYQNPLEGEYLQQHSGIQIDVDATCGDEFIPESLLEKCKANLPRPVAAECSYELAMTAYQYYNEETLAYGINRSLNRPQRYHAHCRTRRRDGVDDEVDDDDFDPVVSVNDLCAVGKLGVATS